MSELRAAIRAEVAALAPLDALEEEHQQATLAWIDSGAELWRRIKPATPAVHLATYFALIDAEGILLVDHKNAGLWLPTGGHVDPGEHPREAVARELFEELGVRHLPAPTLLTRTQVDAHAASHLDVTLWYALPVARSLPLHYDQAEFHEARWFDFDQLPFADSDPHLGRFAAKLDKIRA
ncbi:NUDIX domain-containing protein [Chromobacterium sp. IIBBL 290-4]|uniref:NUDIX domain-containing protein n=1 Tax=Chromobacterium sp. IIBBL 290-4 TaxID=2953890 RepID=UPI0020B8903E|nr:NUDIX hydrolase [Chromobacterium sp. IIBBL 290-4]UTH76341.1 NUDIX hydrolase [Chromobacterium sp. IIBBL 290-4]